MQFFNPLECPKTVEYNLFDDWLRKFLPFQLGGAINTGEEEDDSVT